MRKYLLTSLLAAATTAQVEAATVKLMTLDPAHFHASLVQKFMYPQVSPAVRVYAPGGDELQEHLKRIASFNTRAENPTRWQESVYTGPDFLAKMVQERAGNVVVISGNNAKKPRYIFDAVSAGFNVLADKPMAITPADFELLQQSFARATAKNVLLYDIMTERSEITTILQRELSCRPALFGELEAGTPADPSVTKESVHHFCKTVADKPLKRPAWFFDSRQQGEGTVDVTTHLVDLVQWGCFPEQALDYRRDVEVLHARRWATPLTLAQFRKVTGQDTWPDYLQQAVGPDGNLRGFSNGEFTYRLRGVHAKVSVTWNFEPPPGGGDTHYSLMRGTRAALIIRQGAEQNFKPSLYVEKRAAQTDADFAATLTTTLAEIAQAWPGVAAQPVGAGRWAVVIPAKYHIGHEAHFAQVTERFLAYLAAGRLPAWEVPNMLAKYFTTTRAYQLSRGSAL
jgi:predicted dehydrogenase